MLTVSRTAALAVLAVLALGTAGCGSNNKGKIEGKWKFTSFPEGADAKGKDGLDMLGKMGLYVYMDFKTDGTLELGLGGDKPEAMDFFKMMAKGQKTAWAGKYKLLSGDGVELYDMPADMQGGAPFGGKDRGRMKVKIDGDSMTATDDKGTATLARVK